MPKITAPSQCLIRMLASPINPSDCNQTRGTYARLPSSFPAVGGNEGVGVVEECGEKVRGLKPGDLVIPIRSVGGTWRQHLVTEEENLFQTSAPIPVAACLSVNPPTALLLLELNKLRTCAFNKPAAFIQNGANSGVGRLMIQMAALQGRRSLNLIRPRKEFESVQAELERLGKGLAVVLSTDTPIEQLKEAAVTCSSPGIAFNCVGGEAGALLSKLLPLGGEMVTYGGMSGRPLIIPTSALIFKDLKCTGFWLTAWKERAGVGEIEHVLRRCEQMFLKGEVEMGPMEHVPADQVTNEHLQLTGRKKLIVF